MFGKSDHFPSGEVAGSCFDRFLSESESSDVDWRLKCLWVEEKAELIFDGNLWDEGINGPSNGDVLPATVEVSKGLESLP